MLAQGFLAFVLISVVQGQIGKGPGDDYEAYGQAITETKTATFTFTSVQYAYVHVTETNTVNNGVTVLETTYLKETKTETLTSPVTLTNLNVAPAVVPVTVTRTTVMTVTAEANQGQLETVSKTRTRTLMHWGQNLVKNTFSRTTTVIDKYQVLQMETTIQSVTVPIMHTITVSNTEFLPLVTQVPFQPAVLPVPQFNQYAPAAAQQGTSKMAQPAHIMKSLGSDTHETNGSFLDILLEVSELAHVPKFDYVV